MTTNDLQENIDIAAPPEAKLLEQQLVADKKTDLDIPRRDAERSNQSKDTTTSQAGNARFPYESGATIIEGTEVVRIPDELKQEPVLERRVTVCSGRYRGWSSNNSGSRFLHRYREDCSCRYRGACNNSGRRYLHRYREDGPGPKTSWAGAPKNVVEGVVQPLTTGQFNLDQNSMSIPEQVLKTNNNTKIPPEICNNKTPYGDAADRAENTVPLAPVLDPISPDGHGNLPVGVLKPSLS